jgi:hypothetical protein
VTAKHDRAVETLTAKEGDQIDEIVLKLSD